MDYQNNKVLRIIQWNAQGITNLSTIKQFRDFLYSKKIDIALISETFLKINHKFYIDGYKVYRNDREMVMVVV